jgi:UPF0755 protein
MKILRALTVLVLLLIGFSLSGYLYLRHQFKVPHSAGVSPVIVEIPKGLHTREVLHLLHEKNIIDSENVALAQLVLTGNRGKLQAGEYLFDRPMSLNEVVEKLANGRVYLHKFTVPEGLTVRDTAARWEEQGFGTATEFLTAANDSVSLVHDLDSGAQTLEGYLFPETYSFAAHTSASQAVEAMVTRFHEVIGKLRQTIPADHWPSNIGSTVILASIVESEAAHDDERPLISSVYQNRLQKKMLLQCDTTVIYALELDNQYHGKLSLRDLKFDSRYNTYVYPGLPPGPIMNPGYNSLMAALQPAGTNYIYFVRTVGGRHIFSETLAAHNFAVAQYRAMSH